MSLFEAMKRRGYAFRQHLEEEGWTRRKLTVVDLDEEQQKALGTGGLDGLRKVLEQQGLWTFPAFDIQKVLPAQRDLVLAQNGKPAAAIVAPASGHLFEAAKAFNQALSQQFDIRLPIYSDTEADLALLETQHIMLFGGSHENRLAMDVALRYQTGFVDATIPGDGGWVVTTHTGLDASGHNICQVAASPSLVKDAMACLTKNLASEDTQIILHYVHRIEQGQTMRTHFPAWEDFVAGMPGRVPRFQGQNIRIPETLDALADLLAQGLDSGGPEVNFYNAAPIDIAISCAQYHQRSADPRALYLFRELLFRLTDYYLKTPEGASYPADLDFRIGTLVLYYARLEHDPIFSEDDRLILSNLLLAGIRSVCEYTMKIWPIKLDAPTRHNHETFPGRTLLFAADYFDRYGIADVQIWRAHADATFSGGLWNRYKQRENANHYEQAAFEHGASYSAFVGRRLDMFAPNCLRQAALRHVITSDNFLRPVDYGDASISMNPRGSDKLAVIATTQEDDPTLQWFAQVCFDRHPSYMSSALEGIRGAYRGAAPQTHAWEFLPLDPKFRALFCPEFPQDYTFDKLAFRTGWTDEAQYLLFEGVGNQDISHSHNELNSIVRLNHLGRHWIVSNGYGRRAGLTNVSQSFNTRVRGPEDHNMLVLQQENEIVRMLPRCNALLQKGQNGDLAYATGVLLNYAGINWFRSLFILADQFVLVMDRVHLVRPACERAHIEWNCLGKVAQRQNGFRLDQQGVFMDIDSDSGWAMRHDIADQSADWKSMLESGRYPYASFPLIKLIFDLPDVQEGRAHCLTTLMSATQAPNPRYGLKQIEPGRLAITCFDGAFPALSVDDGDFVIRASETALNLHYAPVPELPSALRSLSA